MRFFKNKQLMKQRKLQAERNAIAEAVIDKLYMSGRSGWEEFLPPVMLRDSIYMVTKNGSIYRLAKDSASEMEFITQIKRGS